MDKSDNVRIKPVVVEEDSSSKGAVEALPQPIYTLSRESQPSPVSPQENPEPQQEPDRQAFNDTKNLESRAKQIIEELNTQKVQASHESSPQKVADIHTPPPQAEPPPAPPPYTEGETPQTPPSHSDGNGLSVKVVILIVALTAAIVAIVSGGVYVYVNSSTPPEGTVADGSRSLVAPTREPTPQVTPSPPSPTPLPTKTELQDVSVEIRNGSGRIGEAARAAEALEDAGFEVGETGNADRFDYEATTISAKSSVDAGILAVIEEVFSKTYSVSFGENLRESSAVDVVIILGAR